MYRRAGLAVLLCLVLLPLRMTASGTVLSPSAHVSVLTEDGNWPLYTSFGHTAVRVRDVATSTDLVFNYGTFDFEAPHFYTNFMRGRMIYTLSVYHFPSYLQYTTKCRRRITEQELQLTAGQRQRLFDALVLNARPENRDYRYDFFFDNCATRVRDMLETVLGDSLVFGTLPTGETFRDLLHGCLHNHPWSCFGLDVILGLPCDQVASSREQTFLPACFAATVASARLNGRPLARDAVALNSVPATVQRHPLVTQPTAAACILLCISLLYRKRRWRIHFDRAVLGVTGLVGLLVACMWFCTAHTATHGNLNLLWAWPTHLAAAFLLRPDRPAAWRTWYFRAVAVCAVLLVPAFALLPQDLHAAVIPLSLLMLSTAWPYAAFRRPCRCCSSSGR